MFKRRRTNRMQKNPWAFKDHFREKKIRRKTTQGVLILIHLKKKERKIFYIKKENTILPSCTEKIISKNFCFLYYSLIIIEN